jgi:alpha-L-fucosidase 2
LAAFLGIHEPGPEAERIIKEASPATYVSKNMPPYLLIHGSKDLNVPVEQSYLMRDAMKKVGAQVEVIVIEGGAHGRSTLEKAGGPDAYMPAMIAWLKKVLR